MLVKIFGASLMRRASAQTMIRNTPEFLELLRPSVNDPDELNRSSNADLTDGYRLDFPKLRVVKAVVSKNFAGVSINVASNGRQSAQLNFVTQKP
jgi:hypothetical protein